MNSREEIISKYNFICDPDVLETVEAMMEEYAKQFRSPDMAGIDQIYSAIESRIRHFESIYHKFEANELRSALDTVRRLVPPSTFESSPPDMAEALRLKWITLTEDMGRMLSGQRGVSIDKLNKVMNLVQEFVNTLPASPGSGWVNLVDELPNYGTIDVWVSDEYSKRRIPNSEYRQRDFYNKSDRFEAFMHTDDGMRWVDITNMVTHWRPLPTPPDVEDNQTKKQ